MRYIIIDIFIYLCYYYLLKHIIMLNNYKFDNLKEENIFLKIGKKLFYFFLFGIIFYLFFVGIYTKNINAASLFDKNVKLLRNKDDGRIYAIINNRKHLIKTPKIFISYNYDFNKVKTISQKEILSYPNIYLAKLNNNPTVYYINDKLNIKKAHLNKKVFLSYGNKWRDIFIFSKQDLDSYKNAQIIKLTNSPVVYEIHNNLKRAIKNKDEFINLGYHWKDIITVNKVDLESYQDINTNQKFSSQPIIQNELVVQIDHSMPKTSYLLTGSKHNLLAKIKFISNSSKQIEIKKIIFQKIGVSDNKICSKFYLQDDYGKYTQTSINGNKIKFYFNQNPILLQPDSSRIFEVRANLNQLDNVLNQTIGIGIKNAKDIKANAKVIGNFPLLANVHKIISGKKIIGKLSVDSLPINNTQIFAEIGSTDVLLSKIRLTETTNKEDIVVRRIIFTNIGNVDDGNIINLDLVNNDDNEIIKTVKTMKNHQVIFDLENSPLIVKHGDNLNLILRGDIEGGEGEIAKFVIYNNDDIRVTSSTYGCDITVKPGIIDNNFPVGDLNQKITIKQGNLVAYLSEKFPQSRLIAGEKNANLASFTIQLNGMNIFLNKIELEIKKINGALDLYGNIKIKQESGDKILTEVLAKNYCGKPNSIDLPQIKLNSGAKYTFDILANIDKNTPQASAYIVKLNKIYYKLGNFNKVISPNISAYKKIVSKSQLSVYLNPKFHNYSQVAGSKKVKIASFLLQANSSEDQIIKSIQVSLIGKTNSMSFSKGYSNLSIYQNYDRKALIKYLNNPPYVLNPKKIYVKANKTIRLDVYVDTTPINNGDNIQLRIDNIISKGVTSQSNTFVKYNTHNGQSINLISSSLSVELNNNLSNGQILAGKSNQIISSIKITNNSAENIYLKNITVANSDDSDSISYLNGYTNLHFSGIWDEIRYPVDNSNKLDLDNKEIKAGETLILNLKINTNNETAGDKIQMIFYGLEAKGGYSKKPIKIIGLPITGQKMEVVSEG